MPVRRRWLLLLVLIVLTGCSAGKKKKSDEAIRAELAESFAKLQEAISETRTGEVDKLLTILDSESMEVAGKKSRRFGEDFAKKSADEQAEMAEKFGVSVEQLKKKMTGRDYLRLASKEIYNRYWMVCGAPIERVAGSGSEATVYYTQDDAERDQKSIVFVREDGRWKAQLKIP